MLHFDGCQTGQGVRQMIDVVQGLSADRPGGR